MCKTYVLDPYVSLTFYVKMKNREVLATGMILFLSIAGCM